MPLIAAANKHIYSLFLLTRSGILLLFDYQDEGRNAVAIGEVSRRNQGSLEKKHGEYIV